MLIHNKQIHIAIANSRKARHWPSSPLMWSDFINRVRIPVRGTETIEEYLALSKAKQDELKDVGGFVGGTFQKERRKNSTIQGRDLVTLDMDHIPPGQTTDILKRVESLKCAAVVYSTRKHTPYQPRFRVVIPLNRTAIPDEYEPIARKLAFIIGMGFCDPTTFDINRLMYWPSCSANSDYVCEIYDNPFCSADALLAQYDNWKDVSSWPRMGEDIAVKRRSAIQTDPTTKKGLIGAFCRTYNIIEAMETFLPGLYEETSMAGRYTYLGGSTVGGAILYEGDRFLYSHHATDPCSGQLVNAFDLVRIHKFGDKDDDVKDGTPANRKPSFLAMADLARSDPNVVQLLNIENFEEAKKIFAVSTEDTDDFTWMERLEKDGKGQIAKTIHNVATVLEYDPHLKDKIVLDVFENHVVVKGALPWNENTERRWWEDADIAGYYMYLESFYRITGREKLEKGFTYVVHKYKVNEVQKYLESLVWDGKKRLETLFQDYLGAEDNAYIRGVARKSLCAAVERAVVGGGKYDYMPVLTGPPGIGKSTLLRILGKDWFSDSLTSFEGKDAAEMIQGIWIVEVGELTALNKQESNAVKQFLSKQDDIYRPAFGLTTKKHPRRCVFFGTSNNQEYLKDDTGDRRYWPVDVGELPVTKSVWNDLPNEADQIWAEAYSYWKEGETLYFDKELEQSAKIQQDKHKIKLEWEGMIQNYLDKKIPVNWDSLGVSERRLFLHGQAQVPPEELVRREKVSAIEVWVECLNGDPKHLERKNSVKINGILSNLAGWKKNKSRRRYGPYGTQRGYERFL